MLVWPRRARTRLAAMYGADPQGVRAGFVALLLASATGLVAGLTLGAITDTLEDLPGLLVLVPAAIGIRGSIFGALGSRLGTAIHQGTFRLTVRRGSVVGDNAAASIVLSLVTALLLAALAKVVSVAFGIQDTISIADFVVVSVIGGMLSSLVVLVITIAVAALSVRFEWDLDNVAAPIVTSTGDVVTLPSLWLATLLAERGSVTPVVATACAVVAGVATLAAMRTAHDVLRGIVRESLPVLVFASAASVLAGVTVEKQIDSFGTFPVLLVLLPPFLGQSGSLGGIFASRVSSKLHLGLVSPSRFDLRRVSDDVLLVVAYAVPVFVLLGLLAEVLAIVAGLGTPGVVDVVSVVLVAGAMATALVIVVAYTAAVAAQRLGLDPDNHGIPVVTSTLDLGGAFAVILAITLLGLT